MLLSVERLDVLASHLMLTQGLDKCKEITETEQFKKDRTLELKIMINGIEIEYEEKFEEFLQHQYRTLKERMETEYDVKAFDQRVKEHAEAIIKQKMFDLVEKLDELSYNISNMDSAVDVFIEKAFKS